MRRLLTQFLVEQSTPLAHIAKAMDVLEDRLLFGSDIGLLITEDHRIQLLRSRVQA